MDGDPKDGRICCAPFRVVLELHFAVANVTRQQTGI
jgi:hypothetical protein